LLGAAGCVVFVFVFAPGAGVAKSMPNSAEPGAVDEGLPAPELVLEQDGQISEFKPLYI
jgi:hypothetical protein